MIVQILDTNLYFSPGGIDEANPKLGNEPFQGRHRSDSFTCSNRLCAFFFHSSSRLCPWLYCKNPDCLLARKVFGRSTSTIRNHHCSNSSVLDPNPGGIICSCHGGRSWRNLNHCNRKNLFFNVTTFHRLASEDLTSMCVESLGSFSLWGLPR